ncbi:hypothetical protein JCM5353_005349 [Sporobolomyces roseus]
MEESQEAVEVLGPQRQAMSSSHLTTGGFNYIRTLSSHPYANQNRSQSPSSISLDTTDTQQERTARLLQELDCLPTQVESPVDPPLSLSRDLHCQLPIPLSFPADHPLSTEVPAPAPARSSSSFSNPSLPPSSMYFDPSRDLASAYQLYPKPRPSASIDGDTISRSLPLPVSRSPHPTSDRTPSPADSAAAVGSFKFADDEKARELEAKKKGRKKLMWWGIFWVVVIVSVAIGIGAGAATMSREPKGANVEVAKSSAGGEGSMRAAEGRVSLQGQDASQMDQASLSSASDETFSTFSLSTKTSLVSTSSQSLIPSSTPTSDLNSDPSRSRHQKTTTRQKTSIPSTIRKLDESTESGLKSVIPSGVPGSAHSSTTQSKAGDDTFKKGEIEEDLSILGKLASDFRNAIARHRRRGL